MTRTGTAAEIASLVTEVTQGRIDIRIEARTGIAMIELSRTHDPQDSMNAAST
jgi:hypothetical protein